MSEARWKNFARALTKIGDCIGVEVSDVSDAYEICARIEGLRGNPVAAENERRRGVAFIKMMLDPNRDKEEAMTYE
jgi:hypothetical protein